MAIKIQTLKKPSSVNTPLIFFSFDTQTINRDPLFAFLNAEEREYFEKIKKEIEIKEKETKIFVLPGTARKAIIIGVGAEKSFTVAKAGIAARIAVQIAKREKIKTFALGVVSQKNKKEISNVYESIAIGALMANFEFIKYKTPPKDGFSFVQEIEIISKTSDKNIVEGLRRGSIIGEEINNCRELSNTPGGDMTPRLLAEHAQKTSEGLGIQTTIFDEKKIKSLGMGGVIGVSKGSIEPPRFIIMEYMKGPKGQKPVVLVGKGVTFDTGGLNLKPSSYIYEMHMDMSGGAAVIHTVKAAARLKLKKNIVGIVPAAENMPSGSSYRPGDVLRMMSGKTVEILNTDAEGRLLLADALFYAKRFDPSIIIDVATLTGAAVVALGQRYSGLFTVDKKLESTLRQIGEETGDKVWPLPLAVEYEEEVRGTFSDLANAEKTRYGGATGGAVFLWQFVKNDPSNKSEKEIPWAHLDIAPRMTTIEGEYLAKGAAGVPIMLLTRFLEENSY